MKRFVFVICLAVLVGSSLAVSAKQHLAPAVSSQGHTLTLQVSEAEIWIGPPGFGLPQAATLTAQVRDAVGQLVDGIEVVFEVEPDWIDSVSITPIRSLTHNGIARAVLTADTTGLLRVTVRADQLVEKTRILVQNRAGPGSSSGGPNIYR